jgi:hypothetical protein
MEQRRRVVEVPPEWLRPHKGDSDALRRAKRLTATIGERAIEQQCRRAEAESNATDHDAT